MGLVPFFFFFFSFHRFVNFVLRYGGVLPQFVPFNSPGKTRTVSIRIFGKKKKKNRKIWKEKKTQQGKRKIRKIRAKSSSIRTAVFLRLKVGSRIDFSSSSPPRLHVHYKSTAERACSNYSCRVLYRYIGYPRYP